jgi:hypothetical protein
MTIKQAALAKVQVSDDTPVTFTIGKIWGLVVGAIVLFAGIWTFHANAVNAIGAKNEVQIKAVRDERTEVLKQYPTWADLQKLRADDQRYWDQRLGELKDLIIQRK